MNGGSIFAGIEFVVDPSLPPETISVNGKIFKLNGALVPAPQFHFGDVIEYRDPAVRRHRYMILRQCDDGWVETLRITPAPAGEPLVFNVNPDAWEIVE